MNKLNYKNLNFYSFLLPILLGVTAFIVIVGSRVINPENIAWLGEGDPAQHFLGWQFFRNSSWSFPLGLNPGYGLELSNAIVFSDSNPLLAFLFKPFAPFLSEPFQYFGSWLLACFVLQAWFGWKLTGLISNCTAIRILATGLFVFAPPMIWRLHGHLSLVGHFLILASLYLTLHTGLERRRLAWGVLLVVAALVHAYLLVMVALIWLADLLWKTIKNKMPVRQPVLELVLMLLLISIVCWQAGYFSVGAGTSAGGFGFHRMNLFSIFDSSGWSRILKDIPEAAGEYEGFNFLGLGVIFLVICALPALISGSPGLGESIRKFPVLLVVLIALTVFAASNKVGVGLLEYGYPLPNLLIKVANVFRASGRMFWPVFYMIIFTTIFVVIRGNKKSTAISLLGCALVIQIVDTSAGWTGIHKKMMAESNSAWATSLVDPFWERASSKYKKVRWIHPVNNSQNWLTLAAYAGTHGLSTDAVYLARVGTSAMEKAQRRAFEVIATGIYESDSLYVLDDRAFHQAAFNVNPEVDVLARINGFNVLAPGWRKCNDCAPIKGEVKVTDLLPDYHLGGVIDFSQNGSGDLYAMQGWLDSETWGRWSINGEAAIKIRLTDPLSQALKLEVVMSAFVSGSHPCQEVGIIFNGKEIARKPLCIGKGGDEPSSYKFVLQRELLRQDGRIDIRFVTPDAISPKTLGISSDERLLGVGIRSLSLTASQD